MPELTLVEPAFMWVPEHVSSAGEDVAGIAELIEQGFDAEQRLAADVMFAERADGKWATLESAVVAARQNLKTHLFKAAALTAVAVWELPLVVWTAHEFPTAQEAFRDLKGAVDNFDALRRRVSRVTSGNGDEGIEFTNGQRIKFRARTKTSGRGLTGDLVILDEAFHLQPGHIGSLIPTMSAKSITGNPKVLYGSSAAMLGSDVLRSVRDRGRAGNDPGLAYVEWCAPREPCADGECDHLYGREGCQLDDRSNWQRANPAMGRRISEEFIANERRLMTAPEFARERLGWHEDPVPETGFDLEQWARGADRAAVLVEPADLGLDVAPNSGSAAIVACGGPVHVVAHQAGTSWVVPRVVELLAAHPTARVVLDPTGPAAVLLDPLSDAGIVEKDDQHPDGRLVLLKAIESQQACAYIVDRIVAGQFVHRDQQALNLAAAGARRRQSGDAWKWSRRDSTVDISPLVGATIAHFVWHTMPPETNADPFVVFG